jgi:hypothetical protein
MYYKLGKTQIYNTSDKNLHFLDFCYGGANRPWTLGPQEPAPNCR